MTTELEGGESVVTDSCAETVRVRILPESAVQQLSAEPSEESPVLGFDPYSSDLGARGVSSGPRRTLDDMRRLSEAIGRNRRSK
jgi:hypothetical protein